MRNTGGVVGTASARNGVDGNMPTNLLELLVEFHKDAPRQGPGCDEETERALSFVDSLREDSRILDVGCGTGAQTMALARNTIGQITAVDRFPAFLDKLGEKLRAEGLQNRVQTVQALMAELPYPDEAFDLIWAEGSIYIMGFANGLQAWKRLLKPGGYIVVSEISWLTGSRPAELEDYWVADYAEIDTISNKIAVVEASGYVPIAHFVLPEHCWTENYYKPILARSEDFLRRYDYKEEVREFVEAGRREAALYDRYKEYYSYVFYIAQKR